MSDDDERHRRLLANYGRMEGRPVAAEQFEVGDRWLLLTAVMPDGEVVLVFYDREAYCDEWARRWCDPPEHEHLGPLPERFSPTKREESER